MYFLIGADFVPTKKNICLFQNGDVLSLFGNDLLQIIEQASYRIFNLEMPLTDEESPINKCGPNLIAPRKTINGYLAAHVDMVTLANNHILDQGEQGLYSTCQLLDEHNIRYLGVGENLNTSAKPIFFNFVGEKIGIYACAEHEFTLATEKSAGANPFDPLVSLDHIAQIKEQCDYEIVLYHGGKEHYQYPSPGLQKTCHRMVDKGADLVLCQHTHCIGCEEKWKTGTIVYGQGNFLFDDCSGPYTNESVLVKVDENFHVSYLPIIKGDGNIRLALGAKSKKIISDMVRRGQEIIQDGFVERRYCEFAKKMTIPYMSLFSEACRSFPIRLLNKLTNGFIKEWIIQNKFTKNALLPMENYIACEAHRELLLQIIREHQ